MAHVTRTPGPGRAILAAALKSMHGKVGKVGWFSSSKYDDKASTPVAYVAAIQEFGYEPHKLPPRMGLRQMVKAKQVEWGGKLETLAGQVFKGKLTGEGMLDLMGSIAEADVRKQIASVTSPELAESTLRNRASRQHITIEQLTDTGRKPLNDTGYMISQVTHKVEEPNSEDEK